MAGIGIDHSKLPGVKEVCRDFAILEDHTLAHNLQEQEIEHHLATNVQRNRLVQHDLQMAKQLQAEEDKKARAQIQKHQKDLERQDCEIAQEIQVKLAFEAEERRRQEEKDEDIARLLQQKELQEEKRRKKHYPESQGYEESYYAENGEHPWRDLREQFSEPHRAHSHDRHRHHQREHRGPPSPLADGASKHGHSTSEDRRRSPYLRETSSGHQQERKTASQGRSRRHPSLDLERETEHGACDHSHSWELRERRTAGREKGRRPLSLDLESERRLADEAQHRRKPPRQDREKHLPLLELELEAEQETWHQGGGRVVHPEKHKSRHQGHSSHRVAHDEKLHDAEFRDDHRRGTNLRGMKQAMYDAPRMEQELSDAEIARKLQEEELLANEADQKAAQVAQDEEIARLLMAEEKKALRKEREKSSFEKRRHDQDWKPDAGESTRSRSREGPETQRHRSDRSSRSQPLLDDFEHSRYYTNQPSPLRQVPKPEHSPKGVFLNYKAEHLDTGFGVCSAGTGGLFMCQSSREQGDREPFGTPARAAPGCSSMAQKFGLQGSKLSCGLLWEQLMVGGLPGTDAPLVQEANHGCRVTQSLNQHLYKAALDTPVSSNLSENLALQPIFQRGQVWVGSAVQEDLDGVWAANLEVASSDSNYQTSTTVPETIEI
ncbi:coiled-coil domain-containing protein 50 isoform X1 [Pitangus sulphuratus]|nr:coiled-coil domain-containing protein 50 isoform X1 [Pitangus sulphuratus]